MIAQMAEKPARGEFLGQHQSSAAIDWHERTQKLRRGPAERAEIIEPIVGADAEAFSDRIDVGEKFAKVQNHAFRLGAGPGREQDHGVVVRPRGGFRLGGRAAREFAEQRVGARRVVTSDRKPRHCRRRQLLVQPQAVLIENELRLEPIENAAELIAVHFHMDGANRRARRHHAEVTEQLLDRIVRQQRDPVVRSDAAARQERGEAAGCFAQPIIVNRLSIFGRNNPWLARRARGRSRDPILQKL
jgi:hypothetical protein